MSSPGQSGVQFRIVLVDEGGGAGASSGGGSSTGGGGGSYAGAAQQRFGTSSASAGESVAAGEAGEAGGAALGAGAIMGGVAAGAAAVVAGFVALNIAAWKLSQTFIERGKALAAYSPELATAGVGADIRSLMADIREAKELGPGIAKLTDLSSQIETEIRDAILPIKKFIIELLGTWLEWVKSTLEYAIAGVQAGWAGLELTFAAIRDAVVVDIASIADSLPKIPGLIGIAFEKAMKKVKEETVDVNMFANEGLLEMLDVMSKGGGAAEVKDALAALQKQKANAPAMPMPKFDQGKAAGADAAAAIMGLGG